MNRWIKLAATGYIVTSIAIVVGIAYVGLQLREMESGLPIPTFQQLGSANALIDGLRRLLVDVAVEKSAPSPGNLDNLRLDLDSGNSLLATFMANLPSSETESYRAAAAELRAVLDDLRRAAGGNGPPNPMSLYSLMTRLEEGMIALNSTYLQTNQYVTNSLVARTAQLVALRGIVTAVIVTVIGLLGVIGLLILRQVRTIRIINENRARLVEMNHQLEFLSERDPLTGLYNRRVFERRADAAWRLCIRIGQPLAVIMIDVDHFKAFNDHYGHQAGDDCLRRVAAVIGDQARRPGDVTARYGGEEFIVLLSQTDRAGVARVAEAIRAGVYGLEIPHQDSLYDKVVTISLGFAWGVPQRGTEYPWFIKLADEALYASKADGRNRVNHRVVPAAN